MEMEIEIVNTLNLLSLCKILLFYGKDAIIKGYNYRFKGDVFPPNHLGSSIPIF